MTAPSLPTPVRCAVVADDDAEMRKLMASVLREAGFEVVEVADGRALIEHLRKSECPALVVTDLQMPEFTGLRALGHIRRLGLHMPVILVTAFGNPRIHVEAVRQGASAVLDKPFSLVALRTLAVRLTMERKDALPQAG